MTPAHGRLTVTTVGNQTTSQPGQPARPGSCRGRGSRPVAARTPTEALRRAGYVVVGVEDRGDAWVLYLSTARYNVYVHQESDSIRPWDLPKGMFHQLEDLAAAWRGDGSFWKQVVDEHLRVERARQTTPDAAE